MCSALYCYVNLRSEQCLGNLKNNHKLFRFFFCNIVHHISVYFKSVVYTNETGNSILVLSWCSKIYYLFFFFLNIRRQRYLLRECQKTLDLLCYKCIYYVYVYLSMLKNPNAQLVKIILACFANWIHSSH